MYMVIWRLRSGLEMCRFRAYFRRPAAERALKKELRDYPQGDYRVERVSFWCKNAFYATVFLYGTGTFVVGMAGLLVWAVLVKEGLT